MNSSPVRVHIAGDHGYENQQGVAVVALEWNARTGWCLLAETELPGGGVPAERFHSIELRYELHCTGLLCLREGDEHEILSQLGDDLKELLDRISGGHSVEWDGNNHVGRLDSDAAEAAETLEERIADVSFDFANTWTATDWLSDSIEPGDTTESVWTQAENERVRIWGGKAAVNAVLDAEQ